MLDAISRFSTAFRAAVEGDEPMAACLGAAHGGAAAAGGGPRASAAAPRFFANALEGLRDDAGADEPLGGARADELRGVARIADVFHGVFAASLARVDALDALSVRERVRARP